MRSPRLSVKVLRCVQCVTLIVLSLFSAHGVALTTDETAFKEVRVGVYNNAPKIFQDGDQPAGILIDLLEEIAHKEGWSLRYLPCAWQSCLEMLERGQLDLMPDVAYNDAREKVFDFHQNPALFSWSQVYARQDVHIQSTFDLGGKRIAVLGGSIQESTMASMIESFGIANAQLVTATSLSDVFALAQHGQADAAIANVFYGDYNAPVFKLTDTPIVFQPARLFYATAQGANAELLQAIDRHFDTWRSDPDSIYFRTLKKWRGNPASGVPAYVWQAVAALSLLLVLALTLAALLRRQVAQKVQHLVAAQEKMAAVLNAIPDLLFEVGLDGIYYEYHSPRTDLLAAPPDQLLGRRVADILPAEAAAQVMAALHAAHTEGSAAGFEFVLPLAQGERWFELSVARKTTAHDAELRFIVLSRDITERKRDEEEIRHLAFFDPLTGLSNRRLMVDRLLHAMSTSDRQKKHGGLLMLDLDNFKTLNDTLGHDVGDLLLLAVASRLRQCVRDGDTIARPGGDEFVVILEGLDEQEAAAAAQAETIAQKIQFELSQPYTLNLASTAGAAASRQHECTACIGLCLFRDRDREISADELMKRADTAMYQAKAAGRNMVRFYDPATQQALASRAAMEADLRQAIAGAQLLLYYQAQVDHRGALLGAEALLRWQHPNQTMISPATFIPLAEETGLILPIGQWVLDTACQQLAQWAQQANTAELTLAINVSARQFRQADFVSKVEDALSRSGADPQRLKIELTESLLVDNVGEVIDKMHRLKLLGVRFSLDDFGTGYSSLSYLKRLPLSQLKIDQSFVRDVLTDPNDATIARTIVALGQSLSLSVIAEGVETREQRDFLAANGCLLYQGYYFSRPLPLAEFEDYVAMQAQREVS